MLLRLRRLWLRWLGQTCRCRHGHDTGGCSQFISRQLVQRGDRGLESVEEAGDRKAAAATGVVGLGFGISCRLIDDHLGWRARAGSVAAIGLFRIFIFF